MRCERQHAQKMELLKFVSPVSGELASLFDVYADGFKGLRLPPSKFLKQPVDAVHDGGEYTLGTNRVSVQRGDVL